MVVVGRMCVCARLTPSHLVGCHHPLSLLPLSQPNTTTHQHPTYTKQAQDGQDLVFTYHNMLKSEAAIMEAIRQQGPFDGICGFSQVGVLVLVVLVCCGRSAA